MKPDPAGQPKFNDLVRVLRQGNEFLARPTVAGTLVAKPNDVKARALSWGVLNRAGMPFNMNLSLPAITPAWLGVPLYFAKMDGSTTTATIAPTGRALDKVTTPLINGAAQYLATAVRLYVFVTDGTNWFVGGA
jgi:hypothetical protein